MKNVEEAIQAYIEALKKHIEPVPIETVQGIAFGLFFKFTRQMYKLLSNSDHGQIFFNIMVGGT